MNSKAGLAGGAARPCEQELVKLDGRMKKDGLSGEAGWQTLLGLVWVGQLSVHKYLCGTVSAYLFLHSLCNRKTYEIKTKYISIIYMKISMSSMSGINVIENLTFTNRIKFHSLHVSVSQVILQTKQAEDWTEGNFQCATSKSVSKIPARKDWKAFALVCSCRVSALLCGWVPAIEIIAWARWASALSTHSISRSPRLRLNKQRSPIASCEMLLSLSVLYFSSSLTEWLLQGDN